MKTKILFIGDEKSRLEIFHNEYEITRDEEDDFDLVVISENKLNRLSDFHNRSTPVLLALNDNKSYESFDENLKLKIRDYILMSYEQTEILNKVENILMLDALIFEKNKLKEEQNALIKKIKKLTQENKRLLIKTQNMEEELNFDTYLNIYNKKYTMQHLQEEMSRTKRHNRNFACVLIDVEDVGKIIDRYGSLTAGDARKKYTEIIMESVRSSDVVGRLGENSFFIILTEIIEKYATEVVKRIITGINNLKYKNTKIEAFASFIVVNQERSKIFNSEKEIVGVLEQLIFHAKEKNRNIIEYEEETNENINKIRNVVDVTELEEKHNLIWEELSKSQTFIKKLLPKKEEWSKKINYSYMYYPFNFIGGDFFDFIDIDENRVGIIFCDVSGHGVSSALYITAIKFIFRNIVKEKGIISPVGFLNEFNKDIIEISEGNIFVATTYGYIMKKEKKYVYGFGGGTSPIVVNFQTKETEMLADSGFVIGLFEDAEFEEKEVFLDDDKMVFFYSDGIYEFLIEKNIINDEKDFYYIVEKSIQDNTRDFLSNIYKRTQLKTSDDVDFDDDITMLAIKLCIDNNQCLEEE